MGDGLKDDEIKKGRDPEDDVKKEGAEIFREHDLPVTHRRSHEGLDRAELKFLGEEPHRDEGKNQNEGEPKEDGIKERLLDGIRNRSLVHEGNLEIEIDSADEEEKDENDVGDRRVEVAFDLAREESEKLSHLTQASSLAGSAGAPPAD
jgi:hypothetical protein